MNLLEMSLFNYRNIKQMSFSACKGINIIYGDNAQGKTNLIEAIWLFTGNSSFRSTKTKELIQFDQYKSKLLVKFEDIQREQVASMEIDIKRKATLNGVNLESLSELNGKFYAVVFSPSHLSLIKDGPKERRTFLDIAISQIKPQYEKYLSDYKQVLDQRNALLKSNNDYSPNGVQKLKEHLEIWDMQIAKYGTIITIYRNDYLKKFKKFALKNYSGLSGNKESLSFEYKSTVFDNSDSICECTENEITQYLNKLSYNFTNDHRQGVTNVGIHRDDLDIFIDDKLAKLYGSQGQQRSIVIALKLAEAILLQKITRETPIMLLDDVMSELDKDRQNFILNHLNKMQVFITCCDIFNTIGLEDGKIFNISNGELKEEKVIQ